MKSKKTISLLDSNEKTVNDLFIYGDVDFSCKINSMIEDLNYSLYATLKEIKTLFTPEELNDLRNVCNGYLYIASAVPPNVALVHELSDFYELNNIECKEELIEKMNNITYMQGLALLRDCAQWWYTNKSILD